MRHTIIGWLTPWEPIYWLIALFALAAFCYTRGLIRRRNVRDIVPAIAFYAGLIMMYAALQTYLDYFAHYVFFLHRLQHLVVHHLGPFLIALSAPSVVLADGAPRWLRSTWASVAAFPPAQRSYRFIQHPIIAALIFTGLIAFWLYPPVHFVAMFSKLDYWAMNLSVTFDGLLFWWLMLDNRVPGTTPVTHRIGLRVIVLWLVMLPQIAIGFYLALTKHLVYTVYAICGRAFPIAPLTDQHLGGLITWIPAAMMSAVASLILLSFVFRHEREAELAVTQTQAQTQTHTDSQASPT